MAESDHTDLPKNVCTIDANGKASVFLRYDTEPGFRVGFVSQPVMKQPGIADDLNAVLSAILQRPAVSGATPKVGVEGSYSSNQVKVYIPRDNSFADASNLKIDVDITGWKGNSPQGECTLRASEKDVGPMPIAVDTRTNPDPRDVLGMKPR